MRVIGIDPGTGSFDFFGMGDGKTITDLSVPVSEVSRNPCVLIETVRDALPLDLIVGPSGYGLPLTHIKDISEKELTLMVPEDKSIPLYDGIRMFVRQMKAQALPVIFTPGVIHLSTVPHYRKANKMDMGTADKVCCAVLAIRNQAEHLGIDYSETSFILVEIGFGFTAVIGVEQGKIVDGLGGTSGGPGFLTSGSMDSELAMRLGEFPNTVLFTGGIRDISGKEDLSPEELAEAPEKYPDAWDMMLESIAKSVASINVSVKEPREILLSGRLSEIPRIAEALADKLSRLGEVRKISGQAKIAKTAAEGAYIIGEGFLGGKYQGIVDAMKLREARGTMFDYILLKGVKVKGYVTP